MKGSKSFEVLKKLKRYFGLWEMAPWLFIPFHNDKIIMEGNECNRNTSEQKTKS